MRILIVTGSSGGHIFPALALINSLKEACKEVLLVLPEKSGNNIPIGPARVEYIPSAKLGINLGSKNIRGAYLFLLGAWKSLRIVIKFKPEVVVGFGSLDTIALMFWAWLFRVKTIIHEQNVIPGRANRLLAKLVDRVAVSFEQTRHYLNISADKIVLTGNPLRKDLSRLDKKEALDFFKFKEGKFNLLITGGSQGSHKLNSVCFEAVAACSKKNDLQVIHITGLRDFSDFKEKYAASNLACRVFDFFPTMQYAYSVADLVICRCGATTVAELQKFAIPAVLVPYPFAYAHQQANARILENTGAALIINDQELTVENLTRKLDELLSDPEKVKNMRQAYEQQKAADATSLLVKEILNLNR